MRGVGRAGEASIEDSGAGVVVTWTAGEPRAAGRRGSTGGARFPCSKRAFRFRSAGSRWGRGGGQVAVPRLKLWMRRENPGAGTGRACGEPGHYEVEGWWRGRRCGVSVRGGPRDGPEDGRARGDARRSGAVFALVDGTRSDPWGHVRNGSGASVTVCARVESPRLFSMSDELTSRLHCRHDARGSPIVRVLAGDYGRERVVGRRMCPGIGLSR